MPLLMYVVDRYYSIMQTLLSQSYFKSLMACCCLLQNGMQICNPGCRAMCDVICSIVNYFNSDPPSCTAGPIHLLIPLICVIWLAIASQILIFIAYIYWASQSFAPFVYKSCVFRRFVQMKYILSASSQTEYFMHRKLLLLLYSHHVVYCKLDRYK